MAGGWWVGILPGWLSPPPNEKNCGDGWVGTTSSTSSTSSSKRGRSGEGTLGQPIKQMCSEGGGARGLRNGVAYGVASGTGRGGPVCASPTLSLP